MMYNLSVSLTKHKPFCSFYLFLILLMIFPFIQALLSSLSFKGILEILTFKYHWF